MLAREHVRLFKLTLGEENKGARHVAETCWTTFAHKQSNVWDSQSKGLTAQEFLQIAHKRTYDRGTPSRKDYAQFGTRVSSHESYINR